MRQRRLSAPTCINLELTEACNTKCRHCYNFWRSSKSKACSMGQDSFDKLFNVFVDAGIFHIVFTGGEPLLSFDLLESGIKKAVSNNISISCNSNLMLATEDKMMRLRSAGLDHILTSLNSHDSEINDYLVNQKGAFDKIIHGIKLALKCGIRVSVNMIISEKNKDHVYQTGLLVHELGCQKLFGTRMVPPANSNLDWDDYILDKDGARNVLGQLLQLKKDTGMMIGTLISYPLCLLGDLEAYSDFVGRGCPAQSGHFMSINVNGDAHVCVHQEESLGNVLEESIYSIYGNIKNWHDGGYRYDGCQGCDYINVCKSGCRMSAHSCFGKYNEKDPLMVEKNNFVKSYKFAENPLIYKLVDERKKFIVPKEIRFRKEDGFYLVNVRWANTISVSKEIGQFLMEHHHSGLEFNIDDFGCDNRELLVRLFHKNVVISSLMIDNEVNNKAGCSIDPSDLK